MMVARLAGAGDVDVEFGVWVAMLACDGADLAIFVQRVYAAVPEGEESTGMAMDGFLADIA